MLFAPESVHLNLQVGIHQLHLKRQKAILGVYQYIPLAVTVDDDG